jgi:1,4-alpha-glucan branching enzyme
VYKRKGKKEKNDVLVILNVTPVVRNDWEIYVHGKGKWTEIFNSDSKEFWGTGDVFNPSIHSELVDKPSKCYKIKVHLPALGAVVLR